MQAGRPLRLGVAGLGRGFMLMLPTLALHPKLHLVAAADPRREARDQFAQDFGGRAYATVAELCADPNVEAVYIATPHQFHVEHVQAAARGSKHVLVEKPMALTLAECEAMIEATARAGVRMLVGHSHSFDAPYLRTRAIIESGAMGAVRMISALNYTDFLYRPRRPEELDTSRGGGVVHSQGAHQIDIVRLIGGGRVRSVRSATGAWDPARPTEGAYSAFLDFEDGAFATMTYSGYAHFDTDEFQGWVGELGQRREQTVYGAARALLRQVASPEAESALKNTRAYGATQSSRASVVAAGGQGRLHNHFGLVIASCERGDLRPMPNGVAVYGEARSFEELPPPSVPRAEVINELYDAVVDRRVPLHSGQWGMATLEVCLAILRSAAEGREVRVRHQVGTAG